MNFKPITFPFLFSLPKRFFFHFSRLYSKPTKFNVENFTIYKVFPLIRIFDSKFQGFDKRIHFNYWILQWKLHFKQMQILFRRCPFKRYFWARTVHVSVSFRIFRALNGKQVGKILFFGCFAGTMWVHFPDDIIIVNV